MSIAMNPPVRPFLPYNNPSISSVEDLNAFDPKRITRQATEPPVPRLQLMAPYVQLDQSITAKIERAHRQNAAPISKRGLLIVRSVAILLRVLQLAGAMGLLVCMLFVRKLDDTTGWICRVPPLVAFFHIVYFIYHVSGSDRVRTPRSSVTYFLFALTVDLAIMSFYSFIAVLTWDQIRGSPDNVWTTIFNNQDAAHRIFVTVFLVACSSAGLTFLSTLNTLYLVRVFRRLASLPVDRNPFIEDTYTPLPSKRWSQSTTASAAPSLPEVSKAVPFMQTRRSDASSFIDSIKYSNVPAPPPHTPRHYPATGHLYSAAGPVLYTGPEDSTKAATATKAAIMEAPATLAPSVAPRSKRVKKSWGNLRAPTTTKRKESSGTVDMDMGAGAGVAETRSTSTSLNPEADGRQWSFSFRKRSGAGGP